MHNIRKHNVGGGINVDWSKMLNLPSTSPTSPSNTIQMSSNFLANTLANSGSKVVPDISKMRGLLNPGGLKDLGNVIGGGFNSLLGQGGSNVLNGLKGFTGLNSGQITGIAGDLAGMGLEALGVSKADSNNLSIFDKGLGAAKQVARFIPGAGFALEGLDLLNKYTGRTSEKQGTADMGNIYGYGMADVNQSAGTKYTLSDTVRGWFGKSKRKEANYRTDRLEKGNLAKMNAGHDEPINLLASSNTTPLIQQKNWQQTLGGVDTRMLAAKKGTKIPPAKLRNIVNKTTYSFEQKNKSKDPILGKENFEDYRKRIGKLNPSFLKDDPYYNLRGAFEGGLEPELNEKDGMYHLGSRNPKTGEILKRPGHPTWDLMLKGEEEAGYEVYQEGDKWFSREKKKYKDGGLLTKADKKEVIEEVAEEKVNVIPEGAFHSRKNNLPDEIAEHVTHKGIPVVTEEDGGKLQQHAEIEKNEIIFHKEATEKIESWLEAYNDAETQKEKDLIAIECGKYIADEILVNTQDNTGLIDTVQ